ncbi:hypothetical protein AB4517_18750 [Vibrio sp. 10N.222.52.C3]|uniref:hypothetical protein n=1 Tax=Vibrio sp. 10N.222.52.C3 TaxID=3229631 RepID=UPI00354EC38B
MNFNDVYIRLRRRLIKRYIKITHSKSSRYKADYWPDISVTEDGTFFRKKRISLIPLSSLSSDDNPINIIGSGPSIQSLDYTKFTGKNVFLNGAVVLAYEQQLAIDALVIMDANFVYNRFDLLTKLEQRTNLILSLGALCAIAERDFNLITRHDISVFHQKKFSPECSFSHNIDEYVVDGGTVMAIAIQIFAHTTPDIINILGLDISNAHQPRFYEVKDNQQKSGLQKDYEEKILPFMTEVSQQLQGRVFNCSPISKLPYTVIPYSSEYEKA